MLLLSGVTLVVPLFWCSDLPLIVAPTTVCIASQRVSSAIRLIVRGCWSGDAPSHVSSTSVRPSSSRSVHESPRLRSRGVCNPSFVHELVRLPMRCIRPRPDCLSSTRECARLRVASVMVKPHIVPFQAKRVDERAICSRRRVPSALESWANCAHACRAIATTPIRGQTGLISAFGTQTPRFVDRRGRPTIGWIRRG